MLHPLSSWARAAILAVLLLAVSLPGQTKDQIPLEHFTKHSDYLNLVLSPDGKHVAARVRDNETVYLLIIRLADGEITGGVKPGKNDAISHVTWVNNERLIYSFAEKYIAIDAPLGTGELFAINLDSSHNRRIAGYRASDAETGRRISYKSNDPATHYVLNRLPNDDKHVLIIEHPWSREGKWWWDHRNRPPIVSKLNIYTGKKTGKETIPHPGALVFANDKGEVNFITWQDENSDLNASYRDSKSEPWKDISNVIGENLSHAVAVDVNRDGSKVYFEGRGNAESPETLYEFDLRSKKLTKLFDNDVDLRTWEVDTNNEPTVGISYPDLVKYHYAANKLDSREIKTHKSLAKAFAGQSINIVSQTEDGRRLTLKVNSATNPGEYYKFDVATMQAQFIWGNYSWIDPRQMATVEPVSLQARDGLQLHGYFTRPANLAEGAKPPLVVLPHGGPHGVRDYPLFDYEVQLLANRGYAVLQINFRGSGGYTTKFKRRGYKQWGGDMINDILDATQWVLDQDMADKDRVCVYGASFGGYAALMSAVRAPEMFQCTIGYAGVYDLNAKMEQGDIPRRFGGKGYIKKVIGTDEEQLKESSPVNHAGKIKAAVMLIHGDEDARVPNYHAKTMRKALKAADKPVEWLYIKDVAHGAWSLKNREKIYSELLAFLDQHIGSEMAKGL